MAENRKSDHKVRLSAEDYQYIQGLKDEHPYLKTMTAAVTFLVERNKQYEALVALLETEGKEKLLGGHSPPTEATPIKTVVKEVTPIRGATDSPSAAEAAFAGMLAAF